MHCTVPEMEMMSVQPGQLVDPVQFIHEFAAGDHPLVGRSAEHSGEGGLVDGEEGDEGCHQKGIDQGQTHDLEHVSAGDLVVGQAGFALPGFVEAVGPVPDETDEQGDEGDGEDEPEVSDDHGGWLRVERWLNIRRVW